MTWDIEPDISRRVIDLQHGLRLAAPLQLDHIHLGAARACIVVTNIGG